MEALQLFTPDECDEIRKFAETLNFRSEGECERVWLRNGELQWVRERYETVDLGERFRTLGFNRFQAGMSMRTHQDVMAPDLYVAITIINDDYQGGTLQIEEYKVPKKKGWTVVYPGTLWHGVSPVMEGTRYTMGQLISHPEDRHLVTY